MLDSRADGPSVAERIRAATTRAVYCLETPRDPVCRRQRLELLGGPPRVADADAEPVGWVAVEARAAYPKPAGVPSRVVTSTAGRDA